MDDILKVLDLESPFRWRPEVKKENRHEFDLEQEGSNSFSFLNFCAKIVIVYDEFMNDHRSQAVQLLNDVDKKLVDLENCGEDLYLKSKDALHHIVYACKVFFAIDSGKNDSEVKQWLEKIKLVDDMNDCNKAALHAIKANVHSLYSNEGLETSISQINMALAKDRTTPFWLFLKGTFLQKLRPNGEVPSLVEKEMFESAYKGDEKNPLYMVYFADCLRDTCRYASKRQKSYLWFVAKTVQVNAEAEISKKFNTAFDLYRKSYELKPNCPVIAFKCANGLIRLPSKYQDAHLIKQIVSACESKFPDSGFGNQVLAMYHEKLNNKIALTKRHLTRCVELNVFSGCMNLVRLEFLEKKKDSNALETLEKMLDIFHENVKQETIISQIISYYVFVDENLEKACEYMLKYYKKGNHGTGIEMHHSCFQPSDGPFSLVDVITDQVKMILRDRKISTESRKFFNDFVRQMNFHNVEVLKGSPRNLLEQMKKSAIPKKGKVNKTENVTSRGLNYSKASDRNKNAERNGCGVEKVTSHHSRESRYSREKNGANRSPSARLPDQRSMNISKFEENLSFAKRSVPSQSVEKKPKKEGEGEGSDDLKMLMDLCRSEGTRYNLDEFFEKWKKLSLRERDDGRSEAGREERNVIHTVHEEDKKSEKISRAKKKEKRSSSVDRSEDESSKIRRKHRHRRSSSASSSSDYSHKRRHRKHKKKHRSSESEDDSDARRKRRSHSRSKRNRRRSRDERKHEDKHSRAKKKHSSSERRHDHRDKDRSRYDRRGEESSSR